MKSSPSRSPALRINRDSVAVSVAVTTVSAAVVAATQLIAVARASPDAEEARAHSDDERAALELGGYAVRPLPCELPDYGVAANPDDGGEAPAAAETKKKPGRPKKSEG